VMIFPQKLSEGKQELPSLPRTSSRCSRIPPMLSPVYAILSRAGLAVLLEVGLAIWVGKRLAQVARHYQDAGSERALNSLAKKPSK